jgi:hypothetical protein
MAGPAEKGRKRRVSDCSPIQQAAIRLFADGKPRPVVAKLLAPHVYPAEYARDPAVAASAMRRKLRAWEETEWWRDLVYDTAIEKVDADLPQVLKGMRQRAKRRVDAARLMLEVSGRHNPRGEAAVPAVIQINLAGAVPRPENRQLDGPDVIDAEAVEEDEDAI